MPARTRYLPAQERAIIEDYLRWRETGDGEAADVWRKHGVSKEGGYNLLRRNGITQSRKLSPATSGVGVREITESFMLQIRSLMEQNRILAEENKQLRVRLSVLSKKAS